MYKLSIIACIAVLLTACQEDVAEIIKPETQELQIETFINDAFVSTRTNPLGTELEQEQFKEGDIIAVSCYEWINRASREWVHFKRIGSGWYPVNGKILKWPGDAERATVDAYYPVEHSNAFDGSNNSSWSQVNSFFTLPCDQTGTNADNGIEWADNMTCREVIRKENKELPISLRFARQTAKVKIRITGLDPQWDPAQAWVSIEHIRLVLDNDRLLHPYNGSELFLNNGEAVCLVKPATTPNATYGYKEEFCLINVYPTRGSKSNKTPMKVLNYNSFSSGQCYTLNLHVGKSRAYVESISLDPWGAKVAIADAVGEFLPVMIVKEGLAHIYLDRAKNGYAQISDSISSAENKHRVHDLVFYGKAAGKLSLVSANNMIKGTKVRSLDLSHVSDLTEISQSAFRITGDNQFAMLETVILPLSVKKIGQSAFEGSLIKSISTPGVEELQEAAFKNCINLEAVNFPKLTGVLPRYCFENCYIMNKCYMPNLTEIASYAFKNAGLAGGNLGQVDFLSVTRIQSFAFEDCDITGGIYKVGEIKNGFNVTNEMVFPSVVQIDDRAFRNCKKLSAVSFPKAKRLGDFIFSGCSKLATIMFTVKGPIEYIGSTITPFTHSWARESAYYFSESDWLTNSYNPLVLNFVTTGVGTIVIHEDKAFSESSLMQPRVTAITYYNGYQDIRGRIAFGLYNPGAAGVQSVCRWQEAVYVDDNGNKRIAN